jgi:hypothetical protein
MNFEVYRAMEELINEFHRAIEVIFSLLFGILQVVFGVHTILFTHGQLLPMVKS